MMKAHRKYAVRGLLAALLILLIVVIYIILTAAYHFDGKCGGWMPFLSGPHDCSLFEYISSNVSFTILILLAYNWYWILIFLILAAFTGYGLGRIKTKKIEPDLTTG